jgi:threonine dehydrogenase-like Zn-dependent dehydrogenase
MPGEALIRVAAAGICSTDLEIAKGYIPGFQGVPGHEFFGHIMEADDPLLIGKRVTAEINAGCGTCGFCRSGMARHCPHRTVLGILDRNGAFAEYLAVPQSSVVAIPEDIPDASAIFIEPLAAALEIFDQVAIPGDAEILLIGDGRLAQLIGLVFLRQGFKLSIAGKHPWKIALLEKQGATVVGSDQILHASFRYVIEASGSPSGFGHAIQSVTPRGTIVLKSTYSSPLTFNPAPLVVNEITLIGSRCGLFSKALAFLREHKPDLSYLISEKVALVDALKGFEAARRPDRLKVVVEMG